jgi:TIR domain/NB-ARC domain
MQDRQPGMPDFFIDYHDADVQWARWIAYQLEDAQYTVFYRERDVRAGMNTVLSVDDALQSDNVRVISLLSPDHPSKTSADNVPSGGPVWSVKYAKGDLLPIKVRHCSIRGLLSTIKSIDFVGIDEVEARRKLLNSISITSERKSDATPPPFPGSTDKQQAMKRPQRYPGILPAIWNVPPSNGIFTDRDPALAALYEVFKEGQDGKVLTHAINGLGGIGKTQVAIEYAHRYNHRYDAVLWVDASNEQTFTEHLITLTQLIALQEQMTAMLSTSYAMVNLKLVVKQWLQALAGDMRWLLILDNIEDFTLINDFIPAGGNGHILMTVRAQAVGTVASSRYRLPDMSAEDGALLLLRRTGKFGSQVLLQDVAPADLVAAQKLSHLMGNLPLALDQAGAYVDLVDVELADYLEYYHNSRLRPRLLEQRGEPTMHHPDPVATTWNDSFAVIREHNPDAYSLLLLCSFLHHEVIPEEVIFKGAVALPIFQTFAHDQLQRDAAFIALRKHSLLIRENQTKTFSMHPLVQVVLRDSLSEAEQREWAEHAVNAVYLALHAAEQATDLLSSHHCPRYFVQVQVCSHAIKQWSIVSDTAVRLLHLMGKHMYDYYDCNGHSASTADLDATRMIEALRDYAALLHTMNHVQEAEELNTFSERIREA